MGIRLKFLAVLISFSVIPLLCFFLISQKLFTKLGNDIYEIATVLLLQTTAKELQSSADNYTRILNREFQNIERHVESYRDDVEFILRQYANPSQNEIQKMQKLVSERMPLFFTKIGAFREEVISLAYFSKSGFTQIYPASKNGKITLHPPLKNNSLPFDKSDTFFWNLTNIHHSTVSKMQYISVSLPVRNSSRLILGYVTLNFDIIKLLKAIRPSSQWSEYNKSFLLDVDLSQESHLNFPTVIGIRNPRAGITEWKTEMFPLTFPPSRKQETLALFKGMFYGEAGYVSLPHESEPALWTYSQTDWGMGILNILPEREVLYRIARHPARLSKWLTLDSLLIVSLVVVIMVIFVSYRSRRMLEPFFTIISAFKSVAAGNYSTKLHFKIKDERQLIASEFNNMTIQLEDAMRMRQGLEVAEEVQHNFYPEIDPEMSDFDIAVRIRYCEETGGDHVDVLKGDDGKVCIVVGDVTGHGVGAALHVATLRALIRSRYQVEADLASVVTSVNSDLTKDMGDSGRFVTLFMLEIDPLSRKVRWVRAGHDPAFLFSIADGSIVSLEGPGIILGVDSDFVYSENYSDELNPGDMILIGTDGIWETSDAEGNQFGKQRLEQIVLEKSSQTASGICDFLISEIDRYRGGQNQEDDVSIVVIKTPLH